MIPYSRQSIDESDVAAVTDVLRGDWLATGPAVQAFESSLAEQVGARHTVAVSSGTAALHAALFAARIGNGHVVATTPISFSASANAARYVGADVAFADIDSSYNIDLSLLPSDLDALVAVHFTGFPLELDRLPARPRVIIEDAAQALGASTRHGPVGNCARSDMTTFSFHPVKSITTGEGGAITTNDDDLAERLRRFRSHGMTSTPARGTDGGWDYDIEALGFNYRLTDIQAALGRSQLKRLDAFIDARQALAARYDRLLASVPGISLPPRPPEPTRHAWHLYVIRVSRRREVYDFMRAAGIGVQVHHVPIPSLRIYRDRGFDMSLYPNAAAFYAEALSLPLYPDLSTAQQDEVVEALREAVSG